MIEGDLDFLSCFYYIMPLLKGRKPFQWNIPHNLAPHFV